MPSPIWDEVGMMLAENAALNAECSRRQVGSVLLTARYRFIAPGYNAAIDGVVGCLDGGCPRATSGVPAYDEPNPAPYDSGPGMCIAIHAEERTLLQASWLDMDCATLYVTAKPCPGCARLISGTPIQRVVHP